MNKARLKVTLKCNKTCEYCINKSQEYRSKWTKISMVNEVMWGQYRSVVISGGEPLMHDNLDNILYLVRSSTDAPIYLQTNGMLLTKPFVKQIDNYIDGIGLSIHDVDEFKHLYTRFKDILRIKPIQLYIQDTIAHQYRFTVEDWVSDGFAIRTWSDGEFDETEEIFILKEN